MSQRDGSTPRPRHSHDLLNGALRLEESERCWAMCSHARAVSAMIVRVGPTPEQRSAGLDPSRLLKRGTQIPPTGR
jgi:hypothetical protein